MNLEWRDVERLSVERYWWAVCPLGVVSIIELYHDHYVLRIGHEWCTSPFSTLEEAQVVAEEVLASFLLNRN